MIEAEKIRKLISINLAHIYDAKNQSMHKSGFVDLDKNKLENPNDLVEIMVKLDLIETESNDDIYLLTEIGYEYAENNSGWYWGELPPEYEVEDDNEEDVDSRDYNSDETTDIRTKGKRYLWLFLIVIIAVYYFLIHKGKPNDNEIKISPKLVKELERIDDSLRNRDPQDTVRLEVTDSTIRVLP